MNNRPDRRLRVLLATVLAIAAVGLFIYLLPGAGVRAPGTAGETRTNAMPTQRADAAAFPHAEAAAIQRRVHERFQQAVYMLHARQHEHAITALHEVLQLAPKLPEAHVNMGFALLGVERDAEAHNFFQGAIELRTSQVNAYYGLALARARLGKLPEAVGAMRTYVHLTSTEDPFVTKARAMLSEWETELAQGVDPNPLSTKQAR